MRDEVPKRLPPTSSVSRELFSRSGNQCAFPNCSEPIVNAVGDFVAQLCHIEAALPGGQRFRAEMSNEERRSYANLMLMCYPHHIRTNDVEAYPVSRLQEMKAEHESRFSDIAEKIRQSFSDTTENRVHTRASTLTRFLDMELADEERDETLAELAEFQDRLSKVPIATRGLLLILSKRAEPSGHSMMGATLSWAEIVHATEKPVDIVREHIAILDRYGIVRDSFPDDYGQETIELSNLTSGWSILTDIAAYCESSEIPLQDVLVDLQFHLLD